jgi:hypothetical protein
MTSPNRVLNVIDNALGNTTLEQVRQPRSGMCPHEHEVNLFFARIIYDTFCFAVIIAQVRRFLTGNVLQKLQGPRLPLHGF